MDNKDVATSLPFNEYLPFKEGDYEVVEDNPAVDFYNAAKMYIENVDAIETAWKERYLTTRTIY